MTSVEFSFITATGDPLPDIDFEVQLSRTDFDERQSGVVMPRLIKGRTGPDGKTVLDLVPTEAKYHVTAFDSDHEAHLHYDFIVPVLETPGIVRFQDILVKGKMSDRHYDEMALAIIQTTKANVLLAAQEAKTSELNADESEAEAEAAARSAIDSAGAALSDRILTETARTEAQTASEAAQAAKTVAETRANEASADAAAALASKQAASAFATAADASKANALASENAAAQSETNANTAAGVATTKADEAVQSATNAAGSATTASGHATTASTKADEASGSATTASTKAGEASASATTASTKAGEASASATTASTKAAEAATSATNAKTSETNSKTSETNAKTSETNAAASKTGADTAKTAAETAKTASETAKTASETARDLAQQWATQTAAEVVAGQGYGAKKYADQAAASLTSMGKDSSNGVPGLTGFWLNLFNAAGTIKSMIASAATAARTWTMPDKSGTVAMTSDIFDATIKTLNDGPLAGFRNKIINGAMQIDQRNNGALAPSPQGITVDRWSGSQAGSGGISAQRVTDAPPGFEYSYKRTVTTAVTAAAADVYQFFTSMEGQDTIDFLYGTAGAKPVTIGFWVKASIAGKYGCFLYAPQAGSSPTTWRSSVQTYTVNAANTWEFKTLTFNGDTANSLPIGNALGLVLGFDTGSGTNANTTTLNAWQVNPFRRTSDCVNFMATAGATWQISGIQLEQGTTATPFERRRYATELILCQRFYEVARIHIVSWASASGQYAAQRWQFKVSKRIGPVITQTSATTNQMGAISFNTINTDGATAYATSSAAASLIEAGCDAAASAE